LPGGGTFSSGRKIGVGNAVKLEGRLGLVLRDGRGGWKRGSATSRGKRQIDREGDIGLIPRWGVRGGAAGGVGVKSLWKKKRKGKVVGNRGIAAGTVPPGGRRHLGGGTSVECFIKRQNGGERCKKQGGREGE